MKTYSITVFVNAKNADEANRKVSKLKDDKAVFTMKARPWEKKKQSVWKLLLLG